MFDSEDRFVHDGEFELNLTKSFLKNLTEKGGVYLSVACSL